MDQLTSVVTPIQQMVFIPLALFVGVCGVLVAVTRNLFHSALALIGALFGIAAIFALLEAEFVAIAQVLIYVGAISTLITFAIMLTRGMVYGRTSPTNRQMLASAITAGLLFVVLLSITANTPWPNVAGDLGTGAAIIPTLGLLFVNDYAIAFELLALLLLVALSGALLVARDRKGVGEK